MYILPLLLSEEELLNLNTEQQKLLAQCSPSTIMVHIESYVASKEAIPSVQSLVKELYGEKLAQREFLRDVLVLNSVEEVRRLRFSDIGPHLSLEELEKYKTSLDVILGSKVAIPYIAPIRKELFEEFLFALVTDARYLKDKKFTDFVKKFRKYKEYFYDNNKTGYVGTAVKFILRERQTYDIILHGINFQIEKKKEKASPLSWRYL